ncbi:MAG: ATP-grasp domain-containing protein [Nanoarchaeota archaeon]|nr:ATP-grasp domain-containing protein [Nanoarchaeota archaeon]
MNILLLSAGRRNLLVRYFKEHLSKRGGDIFAADCSPMAAALYEADNSFIVPPYGDPDYMDVIIRICKENKVRAILSVIDPELSLLAEHSDRLKAAGIFPLVSGKEAVEICFDKYLLHQFLLENGFRSIPSFISLEEVEEKLSREELQFPLFLKPRKGSASIGLAKVENLAQLRMAFMKEQDMMIQTFVADQEWGVDAYVDFLSKKVIHIFPKKKMLMRSGETDKAIGVKEQELMNVCQEVVLKLGLVGPIDIDCFETKDGFVVAEINPRFGGGYPLAYNSGANFIEALLANLDGDTNVPAVGSFKEGVQMFKYVDAVFIDEEGLLK